MDRLDATVVTGRYNQKLWTGNMKKAAYPSV